MISPTKITVQIFKALKYFVSSNIDQLDIKYIYLRMKLNIEACHKRFHPISEMTRQCQILIKRKGLKDDFFDFEVKVAIDRLKKLETELRLLKSHAYALRIQSRRMLSKVFPAPIRRRMDKLDEELQGISCNVERLYVDVSLLNAQLSERKRS